MIRMIDPAFVIQKWFDNLEHPLFLDVGPRASYEASHPALAINLTLEMLEIPATVKAYLDNPAREIVIFAEGPAMEPAIRAAELLFRIGYPNLYLLQGGKQRWREESMPCDSLHYPPEAPQGHRGQPQHQATDPGQRPPLNQSAA
jgi:rhodanese-related sulfurtransferase